MIAGYHWFTDWGRDTMISLEGLTLTTGRRGGRFHPSDVRPLHPRRPDSQHVPRGQKQGLYHTADATLWFFHAIDRYLDGHGRPHNAPSPAAPADRHHRPPSQGDAVRDRRRPRRRPLAQGAEGYQLTWMDAKVGDWVVTPRRGKAVEFNALWYNALKLIAGWVGEIRGDAAADLDAPGRAGAGVVQRAVLVREGGLPLRRRRWRVRRRPGVPSQPALRRLAESIRCSTPRAGRPWSTSCASAAHAGRPPLARPRPPRLQGPLLRRPPRARRRLPPGDRLGLVDRPVHRRLAEGPPRRPRRRPPLPRRLPTSPQRGGPGHHQRDLRRRAPVHPARLHRPGLERRRGAAELGENLGVKPNSSPLGAIDRLG